MTPCFMLEPTDRAVRSLRRYVSGSDCPKHGYHNALVPIEEGPVERYENGTYRSDGDVADYENDERWPAKCECGYVFAPDDNWQVFGDLIFVVTETIEGGPDVGSEFTLRDAPAGAMWFATWLEDLEGESWWKGPDGRVLLCKTPGGEWNIDGRATNCTMPEDNEHRCWVRHGTPPRVTIDKNGNTCAAGAGSIQAGDYHGFLRDGHLT